ncbi:MAG: tetratricopeptide repeat protein [Verrucomicrobia bacterium]|nr:tetratricopeptide repeat protein [Verrucomicrobiota bacterium]
MREFTGIRGNPIEESSYEENLRECLISKWAALAEGDVSAAGHAARGAAECFRRLGRLHSAMVEYAEASDFFRATANSGGQAWTLFAYGSFLRQTSCYTEAFQTLKEALCLAKSCQDPGLVAYVIAGIAETNRILGFYRVAHRQHLAAFRIFRSLEDFRGIVWAMEGIAQILKNSGRFSEALVYFAEAKKIAAANNDVRGFAYAVKCHAECLSELGHNESAIEEVLFAVQLFEHLRLNVGIGYALKATADIFRSSREHVLALECYRQAMEVFARTRDSRGFAYTLNGIGFLFGELGDPVTAAACFGQSSAYFSNRGLRFGCSQNQAGIERLISRKQLGRNEFKELVNVRAHGQIPIPFGFSVTIPSNQCGFVTEGWNLLNQYSRGGMNSMDLSECGGME